MDETAMIRDGEKVTLRGGGPPKDRDPATAAFEQALLGKLRAVLEKPLNSATLLELEVSARLGRQFLMVNEGPAAMPRHGGLGMISGIGGFGGGYGSSEGLLEPIGGVTSQAETFGAGVIREVLAKWAELQKKPPSINSLLSAMSTAKLEGLTDVYDKLKKELDRTLAFGSGEIDAEFEGEEISPLPEALSEVQLRELSTLIPEGPSTLGGEP